ncbi:MAG: hypothetical protein HQL64_14030 [Magnetococcales bacterium]|nr:hypothetical protein [Magnetococcales bacterium]
MNTQQADLVSSSAQAWNTADRMPPPPVSKTAAQVIKQAFSAGDMVTLSVPDAVKGAIRFMANKTLRELPPNSVPSALDCYA